MQAQFTTLGEEIKTAQKQADFPMNVTNYQKSLKAVQNLRDGYTQMVNGQKETVAGFNTMMQATGQWDVSTVKMTDSTTKFNKALADNKIGLGSVIANYGKFSQQLKDATTQQTALQKAAAMQWTTQKGSGTADLYVPKGITSDLTDLHTRYGMINYAIGQIGTATLNWGKNTQWAGRQITAGLSMPIAIAAAGMAKLALDADQQLTQISKVYNTTTNADDTAAQQQISNQMQLKQVRADSLNNSIMLAQQYGAKVSDTLNLESQLAALGKSGQDLYTSTAQVVRIATLGDLDYNTALQMTLTLMNAFHETGQQLGDTFNFINAVENATSLTTKDIADALPRVGASMASLGMSVQETTVLLTAFKEGGVDATAGANALKTAVARAFDPVPKAQKEFLNLGIDIKQVVKDSGGDFLKFMEELSGLMQNLKPEDKLVALKDLFGIQQSNRLLTVVDNLGTALNGKLPAGFSQTAEAIKLMNDSSDVWAQTANQEVQQFQDSASGKFKIALASIQAEIIKVGQPIMDVLAPVLNFVSTLIDKFNSAPGALKAFIAGFAILAVAAGPIIMLVGLFANLVGNVMKFGSALQNLFLKFKPMTEAEAAENALARLANQNYDASGRAIAILAQKMDQLNKIMQKQIDAQREIITSADQAAQATGRLADANGRAAAKGVTDNVAQATSAASSKKVVETPAVPTNIVFSDAANAEASSAAKSNAKATEEAALTGEAGNAAVVEAVDKSSESSAELTHLEAISERIKEKISGAKGETAAMAQESAKVGANFSKVAAHMGSLAIGAYFMKDMFSSSNGVAGNLISGGMALTLMAPTMGKMVGWIKGASAAGGVFQTAGLAFGTRVRAGIDGIGTALSSVKTKFATTFAENGIRGIIALFTGGAAGAMLFTGAVGALAIGLWTLHQHETELSRAQDALNNSSAAFAKTLGAQVNSEKVGAMESTNAVTASKARGAALSQLTSQYKELGNALKDAKTYNEKYDVSENVALRFKMDTNATDEQVREAFDVAMQGTGATEMQIHDAEVKFANIKLSDPAAVAQTLMDEISAAMADASAHLNPSGFWGGVSSALNLDGADSDISDQAKADAKKIGATFTSAFQSATTGPQKFDLSKGLTDTLDKQFSGNLQHSVFEQDPKIAAAAKQLGLTTMQQVMDAYANGYAQEGQGKKLDGPTQALMDSLTAHAGKGDAVEKTTNAYTSYFNNMRDAIGNSLGYTGAALDKWKDGITTMGALLKAIGVPEMSVADAQEKYNNAIGVGTKNMASYTAQQQLQILNDYRQKAGLPPVTDAMIGFSDAMAQANKNSQDAAASIKDMAEAYAEAGKVDPSTFVATSDQYVTMMKNTYSGAIQAVTSKASELWQRAEQADQESITKGGQKRQAALQLQQKKQDQSYDNQSKAAQEAADAENKAIEEKYKALGKQYDKDIKQAQDAAKAKTDAIQATIDEMTKEDTKRQQLFDNEKTRIQRLSQMQNNNIDFNAALRSGNLDSAAKVYNNNQAAVVGWSMDDQQTAMDQASKDKQDSLKAQIDSINTQTQAYVDGVTAQKDALSDLQQAEADAAKKRQQSAADTLTAQKQAYDDSKAAAMQADQDKTQSALKSDQQVWQDKQDKMNMEIAAITANIPKNAAEYQAQVDAINKVYQKYGVNLKAQGSDWAGFIAAALTDNIQQQAAALQSDVGWTQIGTFINQQLAAGAGWTVDQVADFLKTGVWAKNAKPADAPYYHAPNGPDPFGKGIWINNRLVGQHTGGLAGSGLTHAQRTGYPLNAPMFSTEYLTLMEQGEFVVNKKAAAQNQDLLMAINSGQPIQGRHEGGLIGPMRSLVLQSIMGQAAVGMMAAKQAIAQTKLASQQAALNSMTGLAAAPTNVSGNQAIVKDMAAQKYGWTGPEWDALYRVMMMESGFRNTAQNPTSSAYGMFQFLDSTWAGYGVAKTADPTLQTIAGLKYIQARYHDPLGALAHEQTFHWYDNGGYLKPGAVGLNGTGKPEPVFTQEQWAIMSSLIANTTSMASAMTAGAATGNVASESKHTYNVKVDMSGSTFQKDIDVEKAVYTAMVKFQNKTGMNRTIY